MVDKKIAKKDIKEKVSVTKKPVVKKVSTKTVSTVPSKKIVKTKEDKLEKKIKTPKIDNKDKKISHKRRLKAVVVKNNSSHKFLNVEVTRYVAHPLYKKMMKLKKKYLVSCPVDVEVILGDKVLIEETRPISKRIKFKYISKV